MAGESSQKTICRFARLGSLFAAVMGFLFLAVCVRADQVQMQNGDRYFGKVLSLTNDTLVLQSELLGTVNVPRSKVSFITLGTNSHALSTNAVARRAPATPGTTTLAPATVTQVIPTPTGGANVQVHPSYYTLTNALPDISALSKPNANSTSVIQDVRQQLAAAGPGAVGKFDQMVSGLMSGSMTVNDIRGQAKSAADQLRAFKRELGPEADDSLDGYLGILDAFLKETESSGPAPAVNSAKPAAKSLLDAE